MGKMSESSLLRWTQRKSLDNQLESTNQSSLKKEEKIKSSKKKEKCNSSKKDMKKKGWLHIPETLISGHKSYLVKFFGSTEVDESKGIEVVKEGIRKLKFLQQLKKCEGTKTPKVLLTVSVDGLAIQEPKSKKILHQFLLQRISYCADDKAEKKFFSFIAHDPDSGSNSYSCYVFASNKQAEEITRTIGQAFELSYNQYLHIKSALPESEKVAKLERENHALRERLTDIASMVEKSKLDEYMGRNNITQLGNVEGESRNNTSKDVGGDIMEESVDSAVDTRSCRLMSFHEPPEHLDYAESPLLDNFSLDDVEDEDFDPRSGDHCSCDATDYATPGFRNPRTVSVSTPLPEYFKPAVITHLNKNQSHQPTTPTEPGVFGTPSNRACPFGMNTFEG